VILRSLTASVTSLLLPLTGQAQLATDDFVDRRFAQIKTDVGEVTLECNRPSLSLGSVLECKVLFRRTGGGGPVFNPFFDERFPWPARIAVYDEELKVFGEFTVDPAGDDSEPISAWREINSGHITGCQLALPIGPAKYTRDDAPTIYSGRSWKPGVYYLQAIYTYRFLSKLPAGSAFATAINRTVSLRRPVDMPLRSNLVKIRVNQVTPKDDSHSAHAVFTTIWDDWLRPVGRDGYSRLDRSQTFLSPERELRFGSNVGRAIIRSVKGSVVQGDPYELELLYESRSSEPQLVFNPFMNRMTMKIPAQLALFRADGEYVGDLLAFSGGSVVADLGEHLNVQLPQDAICGSRLRFIGGIVPRTLYSGVNKLPPGEYYIQAIYDWRFIPDAPDPNVGSRVTDETLSAQLPFQDARSRQELFRSNVLRLKLLEHAYPEPTVADSTDRDADK